MGLLGQVGRTGGGGLLAHTPAPPAEPSAPTALGSPWAPTHPPTHPPPPTRFPGDDIPVIRGSALCALTGDKPALGRDAILKLMAAVDEYIPLPQVNGGQ